MIDTSVIIACISLVGSLGGSFGGILISNKLSNYRIEQLEKRVAEHNNIVTRTYALEQNDAIIKEKISVINHRITDLEKA